MIGSTEDSLIKLISDSFKKRLKVVAALPGQWGVDTLNKMISQAPAVYVAWLGGRASGKQSGDDANADSVFAFYAVTNHANGLDAQRRGKANVIGAYEIVQILIPLLHGHTITDVGTLKFQRVENLFARATSNKGFTAYACTFLCPMPFPSELDLSLLDDFETYHAEHSLVPGPDEPDAIDDVTLPT